MIGAGGGFRSYSFNTFHADIIPNSLTAVPCPALPCQMVAILNDPDSTSDAFVGEQRLGVVGTGIRLQPGDVTGWIPVVNLNRLWHKELDETTYIRYMVVGNDAAVTSYLYQENRDYLLLETGGRIII